MVRQPHIFLYVSPCLMLIDVQQIFKKKFVGRFYLKDSRLLKFIASLTHRKPQKTTKMKGKKSKNHSIIFLPFTLLILTYKCGATFPFLPFKDETLHFRVAYIYPYNSRTSSVPELLLPVLDVPRGVLQHTQI